mgnify:FL=1|tara:strand:+ start:5537 stop:5764 length:228 start_codon:yes stop_codon:yes gene_type:complete
MSLQLESKEVKEEVKSTIIVKLYFLLEDIEGLYGEDDIKTDIFESCRNFIDDYFSELYGIRGCPINLQKVTGEIQ